MDLRHHLAVVGDLDLQEAGELSGSGELGGDRLQRGPIPGERDRAGAVDRRDGHQRREALGACRRFVGGQPDGKHRATTRELRLQPAAVVGHPHGLLHAQRVGRARRAQLAHAVPEHAIGVHSPGTPEPGQRDLQDRIRRLSDLGSGHPGC